MMRRRSATRYQASSSARTPGGLACTHLEADVRDPIDRENSWKLIEKHFSTLSRRTSAERAAVLSFIERTPPDSIREERTPGGGGRHAGDEARKKGVDNESQYGG